jgi:hypothetical protein
MPKAKYLWATALVALCVALLSGAAVAADSWAVVDQDIPAALIWDQVAGASAEVTNDGTTTWDSTYGLASAEGVTGAAIPINRWGVTVVAIQGVTVAPAANYIFDFENVAPPITTLAYNAPVGITAAGVVAAFDNSYLLAHPITPTATLIPTDTVEDGTIVNRFSDIQSGVWNNDWAAFWVEELAGRVPMVVQGFPNGTYRGTLQVDRGAMAVYMFRTLQLPTAPYQGLFTDVASGFWAALEIEALVDAGIVQGFVPPPNGIYQPATVVTRDAMAVYVARALVGGLVIPTGPAEQTFTDVADRDPGPAHWAYDAIEYTVAQGIVGGYPEGTYKPTLPVDRNQMAVFVWRGFMMATGTAVVLAGPAITAEDPDTTNWIGWTSSDIAAASAPGYGYVGFDAMRLGTNLVHPDTPTDIWEVKFELLDADETVVDSAIEELTASDIEDARDAAMATGDPYLIVVYPLPTGLDAGGYELRVSVTNPTGVFQQAGRTASIWIGPSPTIAAAWGKDTALDLLGGAVNDSTPSAGYAEANMAASDNQYFRSQRNTFPNANWCSWNHAHALVWHNVPRGAGTMTVTVEYRVANPTDPDVWGTSGCCDTNCCGEGWGTLGDYLLPTPCPPEHQYATPWGWGHRIMSGPDKWQSQWWDTIDDSDPAELEPDASGDPASPAANDLLDVGGLGFTGHPTADTTYTWTTTDVSNYVENGDVLLVFCGGSYQYLYVDLATLAFAP